MITIYALILVPDGSGVKVIDVVFGLPTKSWSPAAAVIMVADEVIW